MEYYIVIKINCIFYLLSRMAFTDPLVEPCSEELDNNIDLNSYMCEKWFVHRKRF